MPLKIASLSNTAANLAVTQNAATQSTASGGLPAAPEITQSPAHFVGDAGRDIWNGVTATVVTGGNGWNWADYTYPRVFVRTHVVTGMAGNQVQMALSDGDVRTDVYIGGRADVYRLINGEMSFVRSSTVTGGNNAVKRGLANNKLAFAQSSGFGYRLVNYSRPFYTYYFGIAAVDPGGQIGAVGWAAGYDPGDVRLYSGAFPVNSNTVDLGVPYTEGGPLSAPSGVTVTPDGSDPTLLSITWDAVPGAIGYIPFISYEDPATLPVHTYLTFENDGGDPVQAGDLVNITNKIRHPHADMVSARAWAASSVLRNVEHARSDGVILNTSDDYIYSYADFDATDPQPDPLAGSSFLRCAVAADVTKARLASRFWHSNAAQSFYAVLDPAKTYRMTVWARASRESTLEFDFHFDAAGSVMTAGLTTSWQKLTFEGSPAIEHKFAPQAWLLEISTQGEASVEVDLAGMRLEEVGTGYRLFSPESKAQITPGMVLRDHTLIKDQQKASDVQALTNPAGCAARDTSLETFLVACLDAGVLPWIQIEWYHRAEDWQDIMAYLGAPVSSGHPMALKRAAQGREAPWTDAFERILFEFGNESWNTLSDFRTMPQLPDAGTGQIAASGTVYGAIARRAALAMEASPYWSPKIEWVLGGWAGQIYGTDAARAFQRPCRVGIANYNGGWDVGTNLVSENVQSYQAVLGVLAASAGRFIDHQIAQLKALGDDPDTGYVFGQNLRPTCYEAGPGYQLNGLLGASVSDAEVVFQEVVMKSRAAATGTMDTFCAQAAAGFAEGNFFLLGQGDNWQSRASLAQGGAEYPTYKMLQILHSAVAPARALSVEAVLEDTITVIDSQGDPKQTASIFVYGFESQDDERRKVIVIGNRTVDQTLKPRILTPFASADRCTVWTNIGDHREHNRYPPGTRLAPAIRVDGGGQSGSSLSVKGLTFDPTAGEILTISGDATTYTVTGTAGFAKPDGAVTISPGLATTPADGAVITWSSVVDGFGPDPLCVDIQMDPTEVTVPTDPGDFAVDDAIGALPGGLPPGCSIIIMFEGAR